MKQAGKTSTPPAYLCELSGSHHPCHPLLTDQENQVGRDPLCNIQVDSELYRNVSRTHALIRWVPQKRSEQQNVQRASDSPRNSDRSINWELCDLGSVNGTFLNGQRIEGCHLLHEGDRIQLGQSGPLFVIELRSPNSPQNQGPGQPAKTQVELTPLPAKDLPAKDLPAKELSVETTRSTPASAQSKHNPETALTATRLFPILSTGQELTRKAYLIPGSITVLVVVSLFLTVGQPTRFNALLAGYLGAACFYFVYQLCGKHKPWWLLISTAAFTLGLLCSPALQGFIWLFREVLPGQIPPSHVQIPLPLLFGRMFLGAGLMEELIKAIPVLLLLILGRLVSAPWQRKLGVWEPLDGILLGSASAVGFTLLETLGQYVPNVAQVTTLEVTAPEAQLAGLQLLIPRLLGSIAGHMAYSGYLGYFIGLSVLMPQHRWKILGVGYITASLLHALWNVMGSYSAVLLTVVGVLSYAFLAAAILKARALSPTRSQNFATRIVEESSQNSLS